MIHVVPATGDPGLLHQLLDNTEKSSAIGLHRCHQAHELEGRSPDYSADEWLPAIYDITAPLLEAARGGREPPSIVEQAQDAVLAELVRLRVRQRRMRIAIYDDAQTLPRLAAFFYEQAIEERNQALIMVQHRLDADIVSVE